ncbi:hypothetical protein SK128_028095 [Halocaridina rubra]|uniref:Schlafen AlbA-2 domain-containing protein n=1 Tax=Halocaridina rubra TaxID=373956 RepID=A0AAN9AGY3_HALRR
MLTPDPPPLHPLSQKTSSHRPMESILTIGSHEAPLVKENAMKGRKLGESDLEVDLEKVLTNAQPDQEVNFVYNRKVALEAGQRCHFLPVDDVNHVRRNTILKLVVGLLNTGQKGVIYLGITEEGHVEGITAEPQEMGQFVEGIMKTVQFYLMPRLHAPQYGVRYTNVVTTSGQLLNNVWVVELHAVPEKQHYYNPIMDMNYHIRHGKDTKTLPFVDFCNVVVAETSRALEPEIQRLEGKIQQLRHALEAKGVDTSTVGFHVCKECYFNDCPVQCYGRDLTKEYSTN